MSSIPFAGENFGGHSNSKRNPMVAKAIDEVLREHVKPLMSIPGVVGAGQGLCEGKPCIKVYVIEKTPEMEQKIPDILDGYPVMVEETGPIKALPKK
jgi:hypothetical protein